jgi:hypothetical protein
MPCLTGWTALAAALMGATTGFWWLGLVPRVPPAAGLDRFLLIGLPAAVVVELVAAAVPAVLAKSSVRLGVIWLLRGVVAAGLAPVVLWGSVYVSGSRREWTVGETAGVYVGIGAAVFGVWFLTAIGNRRRAAWAGAAATTVSLEAAGIAMFLALYLGGGKASLPLAGALAGALAASALYADRAARRAHFETLASLAIVGLVGLVLVGRYFSRLGTLEGAALLAAPVATVVVERLLPMKCPAWLVGTAKLAAALLPVLVVLYFAKKAFDQGSELLM